MASEIAQEIAKHVSDTTTQYLINKAPYGAAAATIIGGLTLTEWLTVMGIISIPLTLLLNWYMQLQRLRILRAALERNGIAGEELFNGGKQE